MKWAVIVFTRVPIPGQTKTRMMPYFSPEECAKLHENFLKDIAQECEKVNADIFVCYTPEKGKAYLEKLFRKAKEYISQTGEGLGERMYQAIEYVLEKGYDSCVLIGTDIPELKCSDLEYAFRLLDVNDVVFGPTVDEGYYLVGMKRPVCEVFEKKTYGTGNVLEQTVQPLQEMGLTIGYVRRLQDMDDRDDITAYRSRMRRQKLLQNTHTGRYLLKKQKISIIVPIYNEETTIEKLQEQLENLQGKCEIILVDGGSTDATLSMIRPGFKVLHSEKGRANQMNLGAKESTGDILFFLHSDSELPKRPLEEIKAVIKDHEAGCFGIAFNSRQFFMWTCRVISNHRIKDRKVMFGDQGIFITRELFFKAGMFPALPIMEDYQFSLTLKEMGVKLGIARHRIYTSDRRFPKKVIPQLKVMWKMNRLRKMYRDGVPIETISKLYKDVR